MQWRTNNDKYEVCPFFGHHYSPVPHLPDRDHVDNVNHILWVSTEGETVQKLFFGSLSKKNYLKISS